MVCLLPTYLLQVEIIIMFYEPLISYPSKSEQVARSTFLAKLRNGIISIYFSLVVSVFFIHLTTFTHNFDFGFSLYFCVFCFLYGSLSQNPSSFPQRWNRTCIIIFSINVVVEPNFYTHPTQILTPISILVQHTFRGGFEHSLNTYLRTYFCTFNVNFGVIFGTILKIQNILQLCFFLIPSSVPIGSFYSFVFVLVQVVFLQDPFRIIGCCCTIMYSQGILQIEINHPRIPSTFHLSSLSWLCYIFLYQHTKFITITCLNSPYNCVR